jgi:hypothetical protein
MAFLTDEEFGLLHSCVGEHREPLVEFLVAAVPGSVKRRCSCLATLTWPRAWSESRRAWRRLTGESLQLGPPKTKARHPHD